MLLLLPSTAFAQMTIETSVSRSRLAVGEELTLDIVISNAAGKISKPIFPSIDGFSSYSQGHSQEISIINGRTTSRSIFSYILIANSPGKKTIGPFDVIIGGKNIKVAAVQVDVTPDAPASSGPSGMTAYSQAPVVAPPPRAMPGSGATDQDIFVKAWFDKDEVYVNEPATLTYTIYTRLSSTYKGFEKEPVTTGFWVEDFPPEKTIRRTEQIINGTRYVVADIRKMALFPTQVGVYTIDTGVVAATVEVRDQNDFDTFASYNIFGRRPANFPPSYATQVFSKSIAIPSQTLVVKALPETGKPDSFDGAVGDYRIDSSVDKSTVEEGSPITHRIRITGQGNINTVQTPSLPRMDDFKTYDSSSSANISKNRLTVEGEKVTETVLVPRRPGTFTLPQLEFSYFEPKSKNYRTLKTQAHTLVVKAAPESEGEALPPVAATVQPVEKVEVAVFGQDIRYIKITEKGAALPFKGLTKNPLYWLLNSALFLGALGLIFFASSKEGASKDLRGTRLRRSHRVAKRKLRSAAALLKKGRADEFYSEIARALYGYFADKLNIASQSVTVETIRERLPEDEKASQALEEAKALFEELSLGRFAGAVRDSEEMKKIYAMADRVITLFERVKLK